MGLRRLPILLALGAILLPPAAAAQGPNTQPVACFSVSPEAPMTFDVVTFDSACSDDPDGSIEAREWDLNNDGQFNEATGVRAFWVRRVPGTYTVRLRVTDDRGATATEARSVTVANQPPAASFAVDPEAPRAGEPVTLTSTSTDLDGTIAQQSWDLDGDGQHDDATGTTASFTPPAAGTYDVGLAVTDDRGATGTATRTVSVQERVADPPPEQPPPPPPSAPPPAAAPPPLVSQPAAAPPPPVVAPPAAVAPLRWLNPFPVVRMRGRTTRRGARLTRLAVRAPHGTAVELRCVGRGCPRRAKRLRTTVRTKSGRGARTIRFPRVERFLPAGVQLRITVRQDGMVGKYTRIRIRRLKLPVRVDRCLMPGSSKPAACPEAP